MESAMYSWNEKISRSGLVLIAVVCLGANSLASPVGAPRTIEETAATVGIAGDIPALVAGRAVARQLETRNDSELCAAGSIVVEAPLEALTEAFRNLSLLEGSGMVITSGRIGEVASNGDLTMLQIPEFDLEGLRRARVGESDVKLSPSEIGSIRKAQPDVLAAAFKRTLLDRVESWRRSGFAGLGQYGDKRNVVSQSDVTRALVSSLSPSHHGARVSEEAFQYWSIERFGSLKPFVALTNMSITKHVGSACIETTQLYASHYCEGLVARIDLYELQRAETPRTLVRITFRAQVDAFSGMLGGLKRKVGRTKMVEQLASGLEKLRQQAPRLLLASA